MTQQESNLMLRMTKVSILDERVGTMGASMGGLISLYLGWEINSVFSM